MDDCAGTVLRALRRLGLEKDTLVMYTSDHGEMLGEHGLWQKFEFYEGSCGVPLLIRTPGSPTGGVSKTPVSQVSVLPTLGELCNVPITGPQDGESFAAMVRRPLVNHQTRPVFAEYNLGNPAAKYMIRDGDFKLTYWTHDSPELYDLRTRSAGNEKSRRKQRPPEDNGNSAAEVFCVASPAGSIGISHEDD